MKFAGVLSLMVFAITGCATQGSPQSTQGSVDPSARMHAKRASSAAPADQSRQSIGPRLVIPATGGPPVFAIPLGGSLYQPMTGDPPLIGMPLSP